MATPTWDPTHHHGPPRVPAHAARRGLPVGVIAAIVGGIALLLAAVAVVVVLLHGSNTMRLRATGASMEPTVKVGQTVTATKVAPGTYQPQRGDIVVFRAPAAWIADAGDQMLMKRVVGLPGERVACCDRKGQWTVGQKPLIEPYVKAGGASAGTPTDVLVPGGRLWVMGDNRLASNDSRTLFAASRDIQVATIPVSSILAVVRL